MDLLIRGDDEVELTDEESFNDEDEIAEVFKIDTNLFDFETPLITEWYEALEDCELKDKALRNKAIMEGFIKEVDVESHNKSEELCEVHKLPVCNVRRYMMIKYSFNNDEKYVALKEDEYDDLTITREEACQAYQEIFRIMDEGWMVTRAE
ncbi:hypothetical protein Tco_0083490 [Tanacetum coccineum]